MKVGDTEYNAEAVMLAAPVFGYTSYNASVTGQVSVTGIGFTPSHVIFISSSDPENSQNGSFSIQSSSSLPGVSAYSYATSKASDSVWYVGSVNYRRIGHGYFVGGQTEITFDTMDEGGFTYTRSKSASPTGQVFMAWAAFQ